MGVLDPKRAFQPRDVHSSRVALKGLGIKAAIDHPHAIPRCEEVHRFNAGITTPAACPEDPTAICDGQCSIAFQAVSNVHGIFPRTQQQMP